MRILHTSNNSDYYEDRSVFYALKNGFYKPLFEAHVLHITVCLTVVFQGIATVSFSWFSRIQVNVSGSAVQYKNASERGMRE